MGDMTRWIYIYIYIHMKRYYAKKQWQKPWEIFNMWYSPTLWFMSKNGNVWNSPPKSERCSLLEATILCAEGERRSLNLDLVALNTAAGAKFDDKPSGLRDFAKLKSVLGHRACRFVFPATQIAIHYSAVFQILFLDISLKNTSKKTPK